MSGARILVLSPDLEKYVEEKVAGRCQCDVVSGALEVLRDQQRLTRRYRRTPPESRQGSDNWTERVPVGCQSP